jgi:hypothetical protein
MKKLTIDSATRKIINVIELEDGAEWRPPDGSQVVDYVEGAGLGDVLSEEGMVVYQASVAALDWRAEYQAATTVIDKVQVIARLLGLE